MTKARTTPQLTAHALKATLGELHNALTIGVVPKEDIPRFRDALLHVVAAVHVVEPEVSVLGRAKVVPHPTMPDLDPPGIAVLTALEAADDIVDLALAVADHRVDPIAAVKAVQAAKRLGAPGSARGRENDDGIRKRSYTGHPLCPDGNDLEGACSP